MEKRADLHTHTIFSDGKLTPEELVEKAGEAGISAIAITDHDSVDGIDRALKAAKNLGVEVIPGVEITCDENEFKDIHVHGLFVDHKNSKLISLLNDSKKERTKQKEKIIGNLRRFGVRISLEEVRAAAKGELTRLHVAEAAFRNNPELFSSVDDVFRKFIGNDRRAFAERESFTKLSEAISAIKDARGLAVIAHPGRYKADSAALLEFFKNNGGEAIETTYPYANKQGMTQEQSDEMVNRYKKFAKKYGLLESGGSDFHGKGEIEIGSITVPYEIVEKMKGSKRNIRNLA